LTELHVQNDPIISAGYIQSPAFEAIATHCSNLRVLSVITKESDYRAPKWCYTPALDSAFSTEALIRILDGCPLQTLNLLTPTTHVDAAALLAHVALMQDEGRRTLQVIRTKAFYAGYSSVDRSGAIIDPFSTLLNARGVREVKVATKKSTIAECFVLRDKFHLWGAGNKGPDREFRF
jgi:hypothetical protein